MAYICICNPTTDAQIIQASKIVASEQELKDRLNICQCCKSCSEEICRLYNTYKK